MTMSLGGRSPLAFSQLPGVPVLTVLRSHTGQDDPTGGSLSDSDNPNIYVNGEIIYVDDQVLWFKATEQGSGTFCYPNNPCKIQSAWILNGNPPW